MLFFYSKRAETRAEVFFFTFWMKIKKSSYKGIVYFYFPGKDHFYQKLDEME